MTSQGGQHFPGHPRDLKMVAKRPGWTYLNLEILMGQLRCLKMAQSGKSSPGGVDPPLPPVSLGLSMPGTGKKFVVLQDFPFRFLEGGQRVQNGGG